MHVSNKRKAAAGALMLAGSLALIGAGTGASFTDTVTGNWNVTAGDADLTITQADGWNISADGSEATLGGSPILANSTVSHFPAPITVKNTGDISLPVTAALDVTGELADTGVLHASQQRTGGTGQQVGANYWVDPGETAVYMVWLESDEMNNSHSGLSAHIQLRVSGTM